MSDYRMIALKYRWLDIYDQVYCEVCQSVNRTRYAVEFHHILGRLWKQKIDPNNLIAVCRECHTKIHSHNTYDMKQFLLKIVKKIWK